MGRISPIILLFSIGLIIACGPVATDDSVATGSDDQIRIVSLSGFLTETLFALGQGDNIVGCDITSTYPASVANLPNLGHISQLNLEAILQLEPDFVFLEQRQLAQAGNLQQLEGAGVQIIPVPTEFHLSNALQTARSISRYLPVQEQLLADLEAAVKTDSIALSEMRSMISDRPRVLFIYARGAGNIMVGGSHTAAAAMIELAGGENAVTGFEHFQALNPESLVGIAPDVILLFETGLAGLNGKEGLANIKGMDQTPAFRNDRIISMDGHYLTSFGPRAGQAAIELAQKLNEI